MKASRIIWNGFTKAHRDTVLVKSTSCQDHLCQTGISDNTTTGLRNRTIPS